jgi:outer membrane protein TolC
VPSLARLTEAALARRAELAELAARGGAIDAAIVRLRREVVPSPTIFADLVSQPELPAQAAQLYVGGGVALPLPLFRRHQGELAVARADRALVDVERGLGERAVREEVWAARDQLLRRREQAERFAKVVLPAAGRHLALVSDGWRAGKFDLFRVIVAARDEALARREQLAAVGDVWQAAIALDRATGAQ